MIANSKLRCKPIDAVHSTPFTIPKVHAFSFYCSNRQIDGTTRQRISDMMWRMTKTGSPSYVHFPRFRPTHTTSCRFRLPRCHLSLPTNPLHLFGVTMDNTNPLLAMSSYPSTERKHFTGWHRQNLDATSCHPLPKLHSLLP